MPDPNLRRPSGAKILVVGYRRGLGSALEALAVPFDVWNEKPVARLDPGRVLVHPFPRSRVSVQTALASWRPEPGYTHVISGGEAGVATAAVVRRLLGARLSPISTVLRCRDKLKMKEHLRARGIPMTDFLAGQDGTDPEAAVRRLGLPVVVKERMGAGGRGMALARSASELGAAPLRGKLLEAYVDAPEVSVESFLSGGEILFENITQYYVKRHVNLVPALLDDAEREALLALNRRVIEALRLRWGMTHLEIFRTAAGPLFGEIALRPPGGYIMRLLREAYGFLPWKAFAAVELDLPFRFPAKARRFAAVDILHPGAGRVEAVEGVEEVRAMPSVRSVRIKVAPGDLVPERDGVGQDVGTVFHRAESGESLVKSVDRARATLRFRLSG